ncbi:MAG TPA: hypothetical protein VIB01_01235 [Steroidobacteraceae bacterium]
MVRADARAWRRIAALHLPALALLAVVAATAWATGIPPARFTMDPAALAGAHPLLGAVSSIGVLLWAAAAAICLFTALLLRGRCAQRGYARLLLAAGLLTAWLALDDLFMLHEWFFPVMLGIPQPIVLAGYAGMVGLLMVRFSVLIADTDCLLLGLALAFFAASAAADQLPGAWFGTWGWLYLLEDGCKLLGITGWSGYLASVAASSLRFAHAGS